MKAVLASIVVFASLACGAGSPPFHVITDYGAVGDGKTSSTIAIQKAVDACAAAGGGKVIIPAGRFVSGPIFLKSRLEIELSAGAVLLGSTNMADYPAVAGRWEGIERKVYASLFTGHNLEHVSITGRGTIDGRGSIWWGAHKQTSSLRKKLGITAREPENPPDAALRWPRPRLINLYNCTNILIRDLTILNSPSWNVHPVYCESVTIDNVSITAPADSPNTDAIDPDSCRNVRISNCHFDVGDDCIVIKSGYNEDGRRVNIPCENILISNCTFANGRGGVVIGSEMSGSVRNVTVVNCVFDGTLRGLRIKTALGRGGMVENFRASNLVMRNIPDAAFSITAAYSDSEAKPAGGPAKETIPILRNIHWSDVIVVNANKVADLGSLAESPLEDFSLRNVQASSCKTGIRCLNARGVVLENINLHIASGPAVEIQNVSDLDVFRVVVPKPGESAPVMSFKGVSQALLRDCKVAGGPGVFLELIGKDNSGVTCENNRLGAGVKEREP